MTEDFTTDGVPEETAEEKSDVQEAAAAQKEQPLTEDTAVPETIEEALARLEREVADEIAAAEREKLAAEERRKVNLVSYSAKPQPAFDPNEKPLFTGTKGQLSGRILYHGYRYYVTAKTYRQFEELDEESYRKAVEMLAEEVFVKHAGYNDGFFLSIDGRKDPTLYPEEP